MMNAKGLAPEPRSPSEIRRSIFRHVDQRPDLKGRSLQTLSWPILCIWRTVELTYEFEGAGPSGPMGFTLEDFIANLEAHFPELLQEFGADFAHTLMEQYVSMIEYLPGGRSESPAVAERLDRAVDDLMRSDLPSVKLH